MCNVICKKNIWKNKKGSDVGDSYDSTYLFSEMMIYYKLEGIIEHHV